MAKNSNARNSSGFEPAPGLPIDDRLNGIGRPRMTPAERAKIFMPFNPLKGFQEALREKEAQAEARDDLLWHTTPFDDEEPQLIPQARVADSQNVSTV